MLKGDSTDGVLTALRIPSFWQSSPAHGHDRGRELLSSLKCCHFSDDDWGWFLSISANWKCTKDDGDGDEDKPSLLFGFGTKKLMHPFPTGMVG